MKALDNWVVLDGNQIILESYRVQVDHLMVALDRSFVVIKAGCRQDQDQSRT